MFLHDLPPLNALRTFVSAARHGSFTEAAQELNVTAVAVGRMVKRLEERLGFELFIRKSHGHGLLLSQRGRSYYLRVEPHVIAIANTTARARRLSSPDQLVVYSHDTFTAGWLLPRLDKFREKYPKIDIEVFSAVRPIDFDVEEFDVAITIGRVDSKFSQELDTRSEYLLGVEEYPVVSPALLAARPIGSLMDIARHTLFHFSVRPDRLSRWIRKAAEEMGDRAALEATENGRFDKGITFSSMTSAIGAARDGLGVTLAFHVFAAQYLAEGQLVAPLPYVARSSLCYQLVYPVSLEKRPNVAAFRRWIKKEAAEFEEDHGGVPLPAHVLQAAP